MAAAAEGDDSGGGGPATRLRRLLLSARWGPAPPDQDRPLLAPAGGAGRRGGGFGSAAALLRGLGCASADAALAYPPPSAAAAVVRASADWQARRPKGRRRGGKPPRRKDRDRHQHHAVAPPPPPPPRRNVTAADLWCATGIAFTSAAGDSVDCVVPTRQRRWPPVEDRGGRRMADGERAQRERSCVGRRDGGRQLEQLSSLLDIASQTGPEVPLVESDLMLPGRRYHLRRFHAGAAAPGRLEEIMMFQSGLWLDGMGAYDRHRDWRLDVDNMTYEELLELGDKIGYVSTGLREEEIFHCLGKMKQSIYFGSLVDFSTEMERMCSICQEEYKVNDEVGKLECGHGYHMYCIRQWLLQKNVCPICKTAAARS